MKHKKQKYALALLLCMAFMLILAGCGNAEPSQDNSGAADSVEDGVYVTLYMSSDMEDTEGNAAKPEDVDTLDDLTTTIVTIVPEDSLNAETIAAEYNQLVITGMYGEAAVINEVKQEGNQVWVDFDSKSVTALPIEEGTEGQLFYHLARSITDNLGDVDDVYLTMDGGNDFRLAHLWFEASRPFYSGAMPVEGE
ncbi:MAG: hypothetical protein IKZ26_02460 [Peptococcaceae bacterium]|nr:hypothetical protein [Peptococcaceae bacterium]